MTASYKMVGAGKDFDVIKYEDLFTMIDDATSDVSAKLDELKTQHGESISVGDMFEMQMMMNRLSQITEMSSNMVAGMQKSIGVLSQNARG